MKVIQVSFEKQLKRGINIHVYLLASIGWMSEGSIFIVNAEQYLLRTSRKKTPESTFIQSRVEKINV